MRMISCDDRQAPFVDVFQRTATRAGYRVEMLRPAAETPAGFDRLVAAYRHLSPNPERFELASFRRWFEIRDVVEPGERFVLADSDLVVFTPWDELPQEITGFDGVVGSIGATGDVLEDGINGGFSVWTGARLARFCAYMIDVYETHFDRLAAIHAERVAAGNARASISDMVLLYQWVQDESVPFLNTNRAIPGTDGRRHYIDHNFFMPEGLGVRFRTTLGRKALRFAGGRAYATTKAGERVAVDSVHLGGRYKIMAADIEAGNRVGMALKSAFILGGRAGRIALGRVGIRR